MDNPNKEVIEGRVYIHGVNVEDNGEVSLDFEYDNDFLVFLKKTLGKENPTDEEISKFVFKQFYMQVYEEFKSKVENN